VGFETLTSSWTRRIAAAAIVAFFCFGCSQPRTDEGERLPNRSTELARLQFDDIPHPKNFVLRNRANESYTFQSGETRLGRLTYWGMGDEAEIRDWYITTMPLEPYLWRLTSGTSTEASGELVFDKSGHEARIEFRREEGQLLVIISSWNK
jgi:hypothetical protein